MFWAQPSQQTALICPPPTVCVCAPQGSHYPVSDIQDCSDLTGLIIQWVLPSVCPPTRQTNPPPMYINADTHNHCISNLSHEQAYFYQMFPWNSRPASGSIWTFIHTVVRTTRLSPSLTTTTDLISKTQIVKWQNFSLNLGGQIKIRPKCLSNFHFKWGMQGLLLCLFSLRLAQSLDSIDLSGPELILLLPSAVTWWINTSTLGFISIPWNCCNHVSPMMRFHLDAQPMLLFSTLFSSHHPDSSLSRVHLSKGADTTTKVLRSFHTRQLNYLLSRSST